MDKNEGRVTGRVTVKPSKKVALQVKIPCLIEKIIRPRSGRYRLRVGVGVCVLWYGLGCLPDMGRRTLCCFGNFLEILSQTFALFSRMGGNGASEATLKAPCPGKFL